MLRHGALSFLEGGQKIARGAQVAFLFERSKRRIGTPQSCLQHRIGIEDNGETHLGESLAAWIRSLSTKTMLATCGTLIDLVIWVSSSRFSGASTKVTSAPASTKLWARSIASERPLTALASCWFEELTSGKASSISDIASRENVTGSYVSRLLN